MEIDYQALVDEAMIGVVKKALMQIAEYGIPDEKSFYLSFRTDAHGVILSPRVKQQYPKEITIILQHQFDNLQIFENKFTVNISFSGITEDIAVPFNSIISFIDPDANFGFQFDVQKKEEELNTLDNNKAEILSSNSKFKAKTASKQKFNKNNIIAIDKFRKMKDENQTK